MATLLHTKLHSLKLSTEKKKHQKKVAIVRPLVHEDSLVETSLEPESSLSLEKTSSFSSGNVYMYNFHDNIDSSCHESTKSELVHDTTQSCLEDKVPCLKIPEEMKSDPECQLYSLDYINEIHYYWKKMESKAVFPVDSGILSKQSLMTNHHYSIITNWMIGVQQLQVFKLLDDTLYKAVNLMDQYFKVCTYTYTVSGMYNIKSR